jgi:hypothetical protein
MMYAVIASKGNNRVKWKLMFTPSTYSLNIKLSRSSYTYDVAHMSELQTS